MQIYRNLMQDISISSNQDIKKEPLVFLEEKQESFKSDAMLDNLESYSQHFDLSRFHDTANQQRRDDSIPRLRICFDPDNEIPMLQKWFSLNNHPSRAQVSIEC